MNDSTFFLDKFDLTRQAGEKTYYFSVFPELLPCFPVGIKPSGGYAVYCIHPQYGSCFFLVDQDEACQWVGEQIEERSR